MRRRVSEVSKVDPDEQKKRKRREEAEEEEKIEGPAMGPATPPELVTPFSLAKEKPKVSPLEMQTGGPGISPLESAQPTQPAPPGASVAGIIGVPSADEMSDDSGVLEEESFTEEPPTPTPPQAQMPQQPGLPTLPSILPEAPPPVQPVETPPLAVSPPETEQQPPGKEKPPAAPGIAPPVKAPPKEKIGAAAALEGVQPKKTEETKGFFEQVGKEKGGKEEQPPAKTPEEIAEEEAVVGYVPPSVPSAVGMPVEEEKKVEEKAGIAAGSEMGAALPAGAAEALPAGVPLPSSASLPPYTNLTPQVMEMFDRMVGVMTVLTLSGVSETTFTLNAPQFASSVFFGTQIIIQEYSTAPRAFNIQLIGNPQAVALMQDSENDLMAAFQAGNYNFRVNRFETGYLTERPLFKRKEKPSREKEGEGESPQ
jgi:hypothetical protein